MQPEERAWLLWSQSRPVGLWGVSQHPVSSRHVGVLVRPFPWQVGLKRCWASSSYAKPGTVQPVWQNYVSQVYSTNSASQNSSNQGNLPSIVQFDGFA